MRPGHSSRNVFKIKRVGTAIFSPSQFLTSRCAEETGACRSPRRRATASSSFHSCPPTPHRVVEAGRSQTGCWEHLIRPYLEKSVSSGSPGQRQEGHTTTGSACRTQSLRTRGGWVRTARRSQPSESAVEFERTRSRRDSCSQVEVKKEMGPAAGLRG